MDKSPEAFRTISEVAEWLDVPTHVLRFWESRFTQVKPVKRAGGRRYYRPSDMALLGGIKKLLHEDGLTIRGVQKVLREQGVRHVAGLSPGIGDEVATGDTAEAAAAPVAPTAPDEDRPQSAPVMQAAPETVPAPAPQAASEAEADEDPDAALMRFPFIDEAPPEPEVSDDAPGPEATEPAVAAFVADVPETDPDDDDPSIGIPGALPLMTAPAMLRGLRARQDEVRAIRDRLASLAGRRAGAAAPRPDS